MSADLDWLRSYGTGPGTSLGAPIASGNEDDGPFTMSTDERANVDLGLNYAWPVVGQGIATAGHFVEGLVEGDSYANELKNIEEAQNTGWAGDAIGWASGVPIIGGAARAPLHMSHGAGKAGIAVHNLFSGLFD